MPFPAVGLHPDDFLRELTGETSNEAPAPSTDSTVPQRPQRPVRTPVAPVDPLGLAAQETATADPFDAADPFSAPFEAATQAAADPFSASTPNSASDSATDSASDPFSVPPGESDLFAELPDPFAPDALDAYGTYETFDTAGADPTDEAIDDENSFAAIEEPRAFGQALAEVSRPSLPYMPEQPSQTEEPAPVEPSNFASTTFEATDFEAAAHETTVEAPPDSSHPPAEPLTELPSIAAASTRIEGDIRIGPRPGHHPRGIAGGIVAAGLLFGGMAFAYRSSEPAAISGTPTLALPATPDEGAEVMPDELAFIYGVAVADIQNTAASAIVELGLDGCGLTGRAVGVAVSDDTILARYSDLITDVQPTIHLANGEIMDGRVIGFDTARDLAVVRSTGALPSFLELAGEALLRPGSGLFIADNNAGLGFEIQPVEVLELHGRNGVVTTISVTSAEGSSPAGSGSPLIDPRGNMVALMGPDGRAELADDLRSLVGRYFLANQDQEAICPAPDVAIDPETGEPIAPTTDTESAPAGD